MHSQTEWTEALQSQPHASAASPRTSLSLSRYSTTDNNSAFAGSLSLVNSQTDFFNPELSCSLSCCGSWHVLRYHVVIARVICAHWACLVVVLPSYPQPPPHFWRHWCTVGVLTRDPPVWPSTQAEWWRRLPERQLLLWIVEWLVCCLW